MFVGDSDEVVRIETRIREVIFPPEGKGEAPKFESILEALIHVFTFCISLTCVDCRKRIGRQFRKRVPEILSDANRLAALSQRNEHLHLH